MDRRLRNVAGALSAKERALLVLRSWKEGKDEDSSWRWTMPSEQAGDFNHYIGLMNGVNRHLGPYIVCIGQEVEKLALRDALLSTIVLWQWNAAQLAAYIQFETKEPVTESEYREREQEAREELKPASQLAGLLVERHEDWGKADFEPDQGDDPHDEVIVKPEAWERVKKEKERELAALVKEGTLQGQGRGKALRIQAGSFYDRLEEPVPVRPEWAKEYEVLPDDQASDVRSRRYWRDEARLAYGRGPTAPVVHLADLDIDFGEPSEIDKIVVTYRETLRDGVEEHWGNLGAVAQVISEVALEFDGEDPALPELRSMLDHITEKLAGLHEDAQRYVGPFELPEATEDEVAWVRRIVERKN